MQKLAKKNNAIPNGEDRLLADADLLRELPAFPEAVREYTVGLARFPKPLD